MKVHRGPRWGEVGTAVVNASGQLPLQLHFSVESLLVFLPNSRITHTCSFPVPLVAATDYNTYPHRQTNGPFLALVSGLQGALDACPAMPTLTLETSIEDCLRRPSPGAAAWAFGSTRMFVSGVLSLVSSSPRSLCQAVVSVLVRFVAGDGCDTLGKCTADYPRVDRDTCAYPYHA